MFIREIHQVGRGTRESLVHHAHCSILEAHGILRAGISSATRDFQFVRRRPPEAQALVCFGGEGKVWVGGAYQKCGPGQAYLTPPQQPHAYRAHRLWEVAWVVYAPDSLQARKIPACQIIPVDPYPFEYVLRGLCHEASSRKNLDLAGYWIALLNEYVKRILIPDQLNRLGSVWRKVVAELGSPWNLGRLAREAGMSSEQLRRACLEETGTSPVHYLTQLRMQHAVSLLSRGLQVKEAAQALGYENTYAFSTAFKRILGKAPRSFK